MTPEHLGTVAGEAIADALAAVLRAAGLVPGDEPTQEDYALCQ